VWVMQVAGWAAIAAGTLGAAQSVARLSDVAWLGWLRRAMRALSLTARVTRRKARLSLYDSLACVVVGLITVAAGGQATAWWAAAIVAAVAAILVLRTRATQH
jgi:hypothetical protein